MNIIKSIRLVYRKIKSDFDTILNIMNDKAFKCLEHYFIDVHEWISRRLKVI